MDLSYACKYQSQVLLGCGLVFVDDGDWVQVDALKASRDRHL